MPFKENILRVQAWQRNLAGIDGDTAEDHAAEDIASVRRAERDPALLTAEVRRLQAVIAARKPTLTDEEREAVRFVAVVLDMGSRPDCAATLRSLLERLA
jgi:hypothetical protein